MSTRTRDRVLALAPMLVAAVLAFWSLDFGLPYLFRPDEDVMVGRAVRMVAEHSLDPLFANYPPLVFYLFAAAEGLAALAGLPTLQGAVNADPSAAYLAGRSVSALAAVASVLFTFLAGRRAYGAGAGVLAALAVAVAPLAVRQAHFATTDGVQAAFVAAALWAGLRSQTSRGFAVAGALCGLAACAKYTGGFGLIFVLMLAWLTQERRHLVAAVLAAAAAFWLPGLVILFHPLAYVHGIGFLGSNAYVRQSPVPIGFVYIPLVIWPFGLGLGAFVAALGGMVLAALRRERVDLALLVMLAAYFLVTGAGHEDFFRYQLPMLPVLSLLAAGLLRLVPPDRYALAGAVALLLLLPSVYASVATDRLLGTTDTRRLAADWLLANVPAGAAVSMPYYGGAFYDQGGIRANRYWVDDALAAGFAQGRYSDRYRINETPAQATWKASGPPWQYPLPDGGAGAAARFQAYRSPPWDAVYDTLDSHYLPFWGFENIDRPGPSIAIWTSSG